MAAPHHPRATIPASVPASSGLGKLGRVVVRPHAGSAKLTSRQIRRSTLDALQLLHHRASRPGTRSGRVLAAGLERDTRLIAAISDVLPGRVRGLLAVRRATRAWWPAPPIRNDI